MFTVLGMLFVIIVGAWAGIAADYWIMDRYFGGTMESFWYYAKSPAKTLGYAWKMWGWDLSKYRAGGK